MNFNNTIHSYPFKGADHTVSVIQQGILLEKSAQAARILVEQICSEVRSKDYLSEMLAIYHYVIARSRYMRDNKNIELCKAPYVMIEDLLRGEILSIDCDDYTALLGSLLLAVGAQIRLVVVAFRNTVYNGKRQYSHVFCEALEPRSQTWIVFDPVAGENTKSMLKRAQYVKIFPMP